MTVYPWTSSCLTGCPDCLIRSIVAMKLWAHPLGNPLALPAGDCSDASPSPASPEMPPLIRHRSQRVGELDSDDDFVRPGTALTRPDKGTVVLYHSLPELVGPYKTVTASRKKSFAAKLLKARIIMYY